MASTHARIVVADLASPWRTALLTALQAVEKAVRVTEVGHELRRALEEVALPPRLIVVGPNLQGIGGLEALYQAERTLLLEKKVRPTWPARTVSLITEVRSDAELLDLFRRRGATHFIYREDPIERTVAALLANLKPSSRALVRIDVTAHFDALPVTGAVYDISRTGAQLVLESEELPRMPLVGSSVALELSFRRTRLDCAAEVRGLTTKNGSQGKRLVLGLQFKSLDDSASDLLERMIREAAEEFEMTRSL